jgi:hypothetical protein
LSLLEALKEVYKMTNAFKLGKTASNLKNEDRKQFVNTQVRAVTADIDKIKNQCSAKLRAKSMEERIIMKEIETQGGISQAQLWTNFLMGLIIVIPLSISCIGEFVFAVWTIKFFGLGRIETYLVAGTIVVISLKAFDQYLTALRNRYPQLQNTIFMITGSIGVVAVFLLIFFGAKIRQELSMVNPSLGLDLPLEEIIRHAEEFFKMNSKIYIWMMVSLTIAFTVVGGVGFHEAKQRIITAIIYLRLHKRLRKIRNEIAGLGELMIAQDSRLPQFIAELKTGLITEKERQTKMDARKRPGTNFIKKTPDIGPVIFSPVTLIIIALILFFLWGCEAFGSDYRILFDISGSEKAQDYSGKEMEFQKNIKAVENFIKTRISPGDHIKAFGITEDSFSRPLILLDDSISNKKGAFGEGLAREKLKLLDKWKQLDLRPTAKATDIFGAVNLASISFSLNEPKKYLIIFSDMRQCAHQFDLERPKKIDSEQVLKKVDRQGLIPKIKGVKVICLGVHSAGKNPAYWLSLKEFWTQYFTKAEANLLIFSMERRFNYE